MRITESRLRRIIRSVINESRYPQTTHGREVNNRKWKEFHSGSRMKGAKTDVERRDFIARTCANILANLHDSASVKSAINMTQNVSSAADRKKSYERDEAREFLFNAAELSNKYDSEYLEDDDFWAKVRKIFVQKANIDKAIKNRFFLPK